MTLTLEEQALKVAEEVLAYTKIHYSEALNRLNAGAIEIGRYNRAAAKKEAASVEELRKSPSIEGEEKHRQLISKNSKGQRQYHKEQNTHLKEVVDQLCNDVKFKAHMKGFFANHPQIEEMSLNGIGFHSIAVGAFSSVLKDLENAIVLDRGQAKDSWADLVMANHDKKGSSLEH